MTGGRWNVTASELAAVPEIAQAFLKARGDLLMAGISTQDADDAVRSLVKLIGEILNYAEAKSRGALQ